MRLRPALSYVHTGKTKELAEVHERLADIMMEQEQFEQAAEDYQKSLALLAVRCQHHVDELGRLTVVAFAVTPGVV